MKFNLINANIITLNLIVDFQEYAGQERAASIEVLNSSTISKKQVIFYHKLIALQKDYYEQIDFLLEDSDYKHNLETIHTKYSNNFFQNVRDYLSKNTLENFNIEKNTLSSNEWRIVSTNRINEIHFLENKMMNKIEKHIHSNISKIDGALNIQIILTAITILLLLLGTYLLSKSIQHSLAKLESGINEFFDYLQFKKEKPENIETNSNDEINDMAQSINNEILKIEDNLDNDKDFINEATGIVTLMKDGDFSERSYFQPHNPNLKELNHVFGELIELISNKIEEQTNSLEALNSSLEDRVHFQTLELEKKIEEVTHSRDKAIAAEIAKDEFLANMSHEIRTPLNAILGFVTILKKQITEEKPLNYLNIIDTSGKSLLAIINDILDFSKIQSGKFTISPYEVNIVEEMSVAVQLFAPKAYEKHLIYDAYIDPKMPKNVLLDLERVKQIFSNILSNAIKFTKYDKSLKVNVSIENSRLIISVEDTGIGIAKENISKVFSAFEQADGSTTRKYGGTGLGLSISHRLAQLMDGTLSVTSTQGVGSTFTLNIPLKIVEKKAHSFIEPKLINECSIAILDTHQDSIKLKLIKKYLADFGVTNILELHKYQKDGYDLLFFIPDDEHNEQIVENTLPCIAILRDTAIKLANLEYLYPLYAPFTPSTVAQIIDDALIIKQTEIEVVSEIEEEPQFKGLILIVEDNKTNQMLLSLILDDFGLEYTIANNGLEGVTKFKQGHFDLVLMDENMPQLNGIGAMQQIKAYEIENNLKVTPIVALTASVLEVDKEKFMNAGMDGFVGKPIDTKDLADELSRFLDKG